MKNNKMIAALVMAAAAGSLPAFAQKVVGGDESWKEIGTGYLRDDLITAFYVLPSYWEFPVQMQESEETPGRYRLVNAYSNAPRLFETEFPADVNNYLIVDASDPKHCYIELGGTSYWIGGDGSDMQQLIIGSIADDYYNNRHGNWSVADEEGVCGTLENGAITFPCRSISVQTYPGAEYYLYASDYDDGAKLANKDGKFRLRLPGTPSTDVSFTMGGLKADGSAVEYMLDFSDGVEYVVVGTFEGEYSEASVRDITGQPELYTRMDKSGIYEAPYDKDGVHTVIAVPYADGRAWAASGITREWVFSNDGWTSVGKASYTENIIASNYLYNYNEIPMTSYTYDVEVEQSVASPWLIRLVEPYGIGNYPEATALNYDSSKRYCLDFDFSDFNDVRLLRSDNLGIDLNNGTFSVWSVTDRLEKDENFTPELAEALYGDVLPTGHYDAESHTVTFDRKSWYLMSSLDPVQRWYEANQNGKARIVFDASVEITAKPGSGVMSLTASDDAAETLCTLSGIPVNRENAAHGIYILRKGASVSKIIIK
ncbi:MAG: hypothetical protein K2H03_04295 [Muribaculaceae bacterium]|nr:hypothetical protein [Muribaculaceae bacterium]